MSSRSTAPANAKPSSRPSSAKTALSKMLAASLPGALSNRTPSRNPVCSRRSVPANRRRQSPPLPEPPSARYPARWAACVAGARSAEQVWRAEAFPTAEKCAIPGTFPVGPVAQWLEPAAHNGLVAGSSPAGPTILLPPPCSGVSSLRAAIENARGRARGNPLVAQVRTSHLRSDLAHLPFIQEPICDTARRPLLALEQSCAVTEPAATPA